MSVAGDTAPMPIPTDELQAGLEQVLSGHFNRTCRVVALERKPSDYRSSFAIEDLAVRLDDDSNLALVLKDLSLGSLSETARRAKPDFLNYPRCEIAVYRNILAPGPPESAKFWGAVVDEQIGRYWLFLEKVAGDELYTIGDFATWEAVARWLARWHFQMKGRAVELAAQNHLLLYGPDYYRRWMDRALAFEPMRSGHDKNDHQRLRHLASRYGDVIETLAALPTTVLHGEFYASNVLVGETTAGKRICPIDWEMAALGPGLIDLAALTSGSWTAAQKEALARCYFEELAQMSGSPNSELRTPNSELALNCCRLHIAIQWLGWSPDWVPPAAHAHDWLNEALLLADKLGL